MIYAICLNFSIDKTHTYTVVGDAPFLGAKWDPTTVADDMVIQSDGTVILTKI